MMRRFFIPMITSLLMVSCQTKEVLYLASDYVFVGNFTEGLEGPAVSKNGTLYFVNPDHQGSIGKITPQGEFSIFIDQLPSGSTANGIRFGSDQKMYLADYTGHNLLKIDPNNKEVSVEAHHQGLNQPNDIAFWKDTIFFASDPNWAQSTGNLWRVEKGEFILLESQTGTTNGIEVSPDLKTLYVNESVQRKVWAYEIDSSGNLSNKRLIHEFSDFGMDGMRTDIKGNLYLCRHGKGTVVKLDPTGKLLEEITLKGKKPSNLTFGGPDGKTIFVTLQDRGYIEQFRVPEPGRSFKLP